jgi:ferritin-like metal-binding protein YciE
MPFLRPPDFIHPLKPAHPFMASPSLNTLRDLLVEHVRDLHSAETQYRAILPALLDSATDEELRKEIAAITELVDANISWIEHACTHLNVEPVGTVCEAMRGLIREVRETIARYGDAYVIDAALIANAQRIAHHQIACYGTVRQFAKILGEERVSDVFGDLLRHAGNVDQRLTKVANGGWFARGVNQRAETAA